MTDDAAGLAFGQAFEAATPESRSAWQREVRRLITLMATHTVSYRCHCAGVDIDVHPQVFSPAYFTDPEWCALEVRAIVGSASLLDMGTGTGIVGLIAALGGARVAAVDLNPFAVENARANFARFKVEAPVYEGNVYDALPRDSRFDFIFWNHPFNRGANPHEAPLSLCGFDYQYDGLRRYITEGARHLAPGGRLLLGTGGFAEQDFIAARAGDAGCDLVVLKQTEMPLEQHGRALTGFRILEFVPHT